MTDITINEILTGLATIEAGITGIKQAFATPPNGISTVDFPLFLNLVGPATYDWVNFGEDEEWLEGLETRNYDCILILGAVGQGIENEKYADGIPYIELARSAFASRPFLTNPSGGATYQLTLVSDNGIRPDVKYGGLDYYGIRFTVRIAMRVRIKNAE